MMTGASSQLVLFQVASRASRTAPAGNPRLTAMAERRHAGSGSRLTAAVSGGRRSQLPGALAGGPGLVGPAGTLIVTGQRRLEAALVARPAAAPRLLRQARVQLQGSIVDLVRLVGQGGQQ